MAVTIPLHFIMSQFEVFALMPNKLQLLPSHFIMNQFEVQKLATKSPMAFIFTFHYEPIRSLSRPESKPIYLATLHFIMSQFEVRA